MKETLAAAAVRIVHQSRAAQGLPSTIQDPRAVARVLRGIDELSETRTVPGAA